MAKLKINNARWDGVPFIIEAGKALDKSCAEVRIKFRRPPGYTTMFGNFDIPNNELVLSIQPDHIVKFNLNIKIPGFKTQPMMSSLNLNYASQFPELTKTIPEAYTRLILDVLRGQNTTFVRDDELKASWSIFTPLLNILDSTDCPKPYLYQYGSQRPIEATSFLNKIVN
jgi:glucose-6-phosphate 1-dehydrogenase